MAEVASIVLMWHMHQPYYKDPVRGEYALPWTYLHATKDYYDMAAIIEDVPGARVVINVVPSLLEQLEEYAHDIAIDPFIRRTRLSPQEMSVEDRLFILENFFSAHQERMIATHRRYLELYYMVGEGKPGAAAERLRHFSDQDFLDLQVCFLLAWTGEAARRRFPVCSQLIDKDQGYTEAERDALVAVHQAILKDIVPLYRRLYQQGSIELTVSPYYHPILPLLCDTNTARTAMPDASLPKEPLRAPEDARAQVLQGIQYFTSVFGSPPRGMWPSEGSVSDEVLEILQQCGIQWVATDEEILAKSLGDGLSGPSRSSLYHCWRYKDHEAGLGMLFRDHQLSDLIGFTYSAWDARRAVADFLGRLHHLSQAGARTISVILDGENAWEFYENNGYDFLRLLYQSLVADARFTMQTGTDVFRHDTGEHRLWHIHPGSWINGTYGIWIGHPEENLGWEQIRLARQTMLRVEPAVAPFLASGILPDNERLRLLCTSLYAAEGSDWFWWYGDDHYCPHSDRFDRLFRLHLTNIYTLLEQPTPQALLEPIKQIRPAGLMREPAGFVYPTIDGMVGDYFEWLAAGNYDLTRQGSAMHSSERLLQNLFWGYNNDAFCLRIDAFDPCDQLLTDNDRIELSLVAGSAYRITVMKTAQTAAIERRDDHGWVLQAQIPVAIQQVLECAIPLEVFEELPSRWYLSVQLTCQEVARGRWPSDGSLVLTYEGETLESTDWIV